MLRKIITKSDAAHEWVREFNAIDRGIIEKLMSIDIDDWQEVTTPRVCDRVYCFDSETYGEVVDIDNNDYTINLDDGTEITLSISDFEVERYDLLPMWGTMWSFGDGLDDEWLSDYDGIKLMSECGFRIFFTQESSGISSALMEQDMIFTKHTGYLFTKQEDYIGTKRSVKK